MFTSQDIRRERVFVGCPALRCSPEVVPQSAAATQCNAMQCSKLHAISYFPNCVVSRWKGRLNVCFWEICWSLRMFCRWNCTVEYMALILWEREDEKRCFGNRGIRNSKGRNCEIGANIVKFLPQNHAQHEYHFLQMQRLVANSITAEK